MVTWLREFEKQDGSALIPSLIAGAQAREVAMIATVGSGSDITSSIAALRKEAASYTRCGLFRHASGTVFGEGPSDAPLSASKNRNAAEQASMELVEPKGGSLVGRSVTINRPRKELYDFWRDFAHLPSFMENVEKVDIVDNLTSHWKVKAPGGKTVEWDAAITEDRPNEMIAWASTQGADVPNSGRIDFRDAGARGTVVTAMILYDPPAGLIGKVIAKMFQRERAIRPGAT